MTKTSMSAAACAIAALLALSACGGDDDAGEPANTAAAMSSGATVPAPAMASAPMQAVLHAHAQLGPKPIETLSPEEARRQPTPADGVKQVLATQGKDTMPMALVPGVRHADRTIRGAAGQLPARIYTPEGAGPFPVIVYFHGGGWVIGSKEVYDGGARGLAKAANAIVVSVDYRLAPEHKFPAQHDDALAAYRWALANAPSFNGDPKRVAVAGESAGGNLAVATAIAARDAAIQKPIHVLSVYPIAQADTTTASYVEHANAKPLNRAMMGWFAKHTTQAPADLQDPRISLVKANLRDLPPVTIVAAGIDPLRTDGEMLEKALKDAGVAVERRQWDGAAHEFFGMGAVVPAAMEAQQWAGERMKAAFAS